MGGKEGLPSRGRGPVVVTVAAGGGRADLAPFPSGFPTEEFSEGVSILVTAPQTPVMVTRPSRRHDNLTENSTQKTDGRLLDRGQRKIRKRSSERRCERRRALGG